MDSGHITGFKEFLASLIEAGVILPEDDARTIQSKMQAYTNGWIFKKEKTVAVHYEQVNQGWLNVHASGIADAIKKAKADLLEDFYNLFVIDCIEVDGEEIDVSDWEV